MSHWNHRVMRRVYGPPDWDPQGEPEIIDAIHEVYYDDAGNVVGWTDNPSAPLAYVSENETINEQLKRFERACESPILDWESGKPIEEKTNG